MEEDNKELAEANNQFTKLYQKQVNSIKILKGIGLPERKPAKKDLGYLSIEKLKDPKGQPEVHYLVYRNFMGATLFTGIINKAVAKLKEDNAKPMKQKLKVAVAVRDTETGKYVPEHCVLKFPNEHDKKSFIKVFSDVSGVIPQ